MPYGYESVTKSTLAHPLDWFDISSFTFLYFLYDTFFSHRCMKFSEANSGTSYWKRSLMIESRYGKLEQSAVSKFSSFFSYILRIQALASTGSKNSVN